MRLFFCALLTILPLNAHAKWTVKSEFQLQLNEGLFDQVIEDFWQSLQGQQTVEIGSFTVTPGGIPIAIQGVRADVNYAFSLPKRVAGAREWALQSEQLAARLRVDRISASQTIIREIDGIIFEIRLEAECRNVVLRLPEGTTRIAARIRAELANNQLQLSMPHYEAEWAAGAWQVESMSCTGVEGFGELVKKEALAALSSFQNFDAEVRAGLDERFAQWSRDASVLLLSAVELPSGKDYLRVHYEPREARENGGGVQLTGMLRFEYPFVAPGQEIEHTYTLTGVKSARTANPEFVLPFGTIRSLMMGEYFAGKLAYAMKSSEIPAFTEFMGNRWAQFWAFPELQRYPVNAEFAFQFNPGGPPSFEGERFEGNNTIGGTLNLPLRIGMLPLIGGKYTPMVEFQTLLAGRTSLQLLGNGKVELQVVSENHPITYAWSQSYLNKYGATKRIAAETIADKVRNSLGADGFALTMPTLRVGKALQLAPKKWLLEGKNLRLEFVAEKTAAKKK